MDSKRCTVLASIMHTQIFGKYTDKRNADVIRKRGVANPFSPSSTIYGLTDYKLTLNVKKCKSMLISRKVSSQISSLPPISLLNSPLDKVLSYRYLGVLITASLSWSDHITTVCSKARRQLGYLYRKFYNHVTPDTLKTLYT